MTKETTLSSLQKIKRLKEKIKVIENNFTELFNKVRERAKLFYSINILEEYDFPKDKELFLEMQLNKTEDEINFYFEIKRFYDDDSEDDFSLSADKIAFCSDQEFEASLIKGIREIEKQKEQYELEKQKHEQEKKDKDLQTYLRLKEMFEKNE